MCLGIQKWLVFGGSWGSTLGLYYAQKFPSKCLGLIIRGIFLNTKDEFDAVYAQKSFENNPHRLNEFKTFFELAAQEAKKLGEADLDPNESVCQSLESFPSHINQECLFWPMVQTLFVYFSYLWFSTSHLWSPAGHNQSNSNLLTSINRAITFYDAQIL